MTRSLVVAPFFASGLLLAGCTQTTPPPPAASSAAAAKIPLSAMPKIESAAVMNHIKTLASDEFEGRAPGTPGEEKTVQYVEAEFKKLGGKVVGTQHITPDAKDFSAVAPAVHNSGADVVDDGGESPQAGPLSKQIKDAGAKIPLVGGDGIYAEDFIKLAGSGAAGDLSTSVGAPVEDLPSAKEFVANYKAANYKEDYAAYGGYSYDSAWSIDRKSVV